MVTRTLLTAAFACGFAAVGMGAQTSVPGCCTKTTKTVESLVTQTKLRCSLTNKTVDKCCCVEKQGSLHCTLADKPVDPCCCEPVKGAEQPSKK